MKFNCCSSFLSVGAVVMAASSRLGVLMKLDKNQRKPRVFKASDLCPYYNRRVNATNNSCCFHEFQNPFLLVLRDVGKHSIQYLCSYYLRSFPGYTGKIKGKRNCVGTENRWILYMLDQNRSNWPGQIPISGIEKGRRMC